MLGEGSVLVERRLHSWFMPSPVQPSFFGLTPDIVFWYRLCSSVEIVAADNGEPGRPRSFFYFEESFNLTVPPDLVMIANIPVLQTPANKEHHRFLKKKIKPIPVTDLGGL
jgi:hypothetical protein